jgi:transposase
MRFSEAERDRVRTREAAKQDQIRARHRLSKFLLRSGQRPPSGVRPWTRPYLIWVALLRFAQIAQQATRQDYLHEVEHMRERVARLEQAIMEAVKLASPALQQVINDLQALRGIADISAVTIAAELGQVSRFESARQLMSYCGAVPSEDSSGQRTRRGGITKTGNAHLRRIVVEAAWSYRRPPCIWYGLRRRQESILEEVKEIAWKAPTDHDYAVPTREYQTDQSTLVTAQAAARFVLAEGQQQLQKQLHRIRGVDRVTPCQSKITHAALFQGSSSD